MDKPSDAFVKASAGIEIRVPQGRGHLRSRSAGKDRQEKPTLDESSVRTKTDTGRHDEDSKALERTLVKELGKLTP